VPPNICHLRLWQLIDDKYEWPTIAAFQQLAEELCLPELRAVWYVEHVRRNVLVFNRLKNNACLPQARLSEKADVFDFSL
jgi:hypothetical protein